MRPVVLMLAVAGAMSGCALIDGARSAGDSIRDAGPEVWAAEARVMASCTVPDELAAAMTALETVYAAKGIEPADVRSKALTIARCGEEPA